jgi:AcrR family transcriptional regulator
MVFVPRTKKPKRAYHHGDLRNALIESALVLLSEKSASTLTLREVSRKAGVNHRAAYRHFSDKMALLAAVAESGYRMLLEDMRHALEAELRSTARERLLALSAAYVAFAMDHSAQYRIMFGRRLNEDGRFEELEGRATEAFALWAGEVTMGQMRRQLGERPVRETGFALWSFLHGFASLVVTRRIKLKRTLVKDYVAQVLEPFFSGLASAMPKLSHSTSAVKD